MAVRELGMAVSGIEKITSARWLELDGTVNDMAVKLTQEMIEGARCSDMAARDFL